jgi:thiaminase (transcriptional activator TenA)
VSLFAELRSASAADWRRYVAHPFVAGMADGSLPEPVFRAYLVQDYLFLIQFARAFALAAYKSDRLEDMRQATGGLDAILNLEMGLHVRYCAGWGIDEAALGQAEEHPHTVAYTRYVLDTGNAGDLLDLHVALAPCMLGYGEIGARLLQDPATRRDGNPYFGWIEMYGGEDYQAAAGAEAAVIDRLYRRRGGPARLPDLRRIFATATRLEAAFWQMGFDLAGTNSATGL